MGDEGGDIVLGIEEGVPLEGPEADIAVGEPGEEERVGLGSSGAANPRRFR